MIKIKTINNNFLKNLKTGKKYYIFDKNTLCYGKYIKNYIENKNENRFIFQDVIYIKTNFLVINGAWAGQNRSKTVPKASQDMQLLIPKVWRDLAKLDFRTPQAHEDVDVRISRV